jgi:ankyrin repeat protein
MTSETEPVNPTMLLSCARDNDVEGIHALVTECNLPVDYCNIIGQTALHIAALHGNVEAVTTLLSLALQAQIPDFANIPNQRGQTPLHFAAAAKQNALQVCNILLDADADPCLDDAMGRFPYETTPDPVIKKLLGGPDPRIFSIAASGDIRAMKAFFEESPDHEVAVFDGEGNSPLHYAVAGNHLGVISYLVGERGAFINMQNIDHVSVRSMG